MSAGDFSWPLVNGGEIVFWKMGDDSWAADHHSSSRGSVGYIATSEPLHRAQEIALAWLAEAGLEVGPSAEDLAWPGTRQAGTCLFLIAENPAVPPIERDLFTGNAIPRRRTPRDDDPGF
jgi:hypothetical protein